MARERGLPFIDLARLRIGDGTRPERAAPTPETTDGIHLNPFGYWEAATALGQAFGGRGVPLWTARIEAEDDKPGVGSFNMAPITGLKRTGMGLRFESLDDRLPDPPAPEGVPEPLRPRTAG